MGNVAITKEIDTWNKQNINKDISIISYNDHILLISVICDQNHIIELIIPSKYPYYDSGYFSIKEIYIEGIKQLNFIGKINKKISIHKTTLYDILVFLSKNVHKYKNDQLQKLHEKVNIIESNFVIQNDLNENEEIDDTFVLINSSKITKSAVQDNSKIDPNIEEKIINSSLIAKSTVQDNSNIDPTIRQHIIKEHQSEHNCCCICMEQITNRIALVPCGHTSLCNDCVKTFAPDKCPICSKAYTSIINIYI